MFIGVQNIPGGSSVSTTDICLSCCSKWTILAFSQKSILIDTVKAVHLVFSVSYFLLFDKRPCLYILHKSYVINDSYHAFKEKLQTQDLNIYHATHRPLYSYKKLFRSLRFVSRLYNSQRPEGGTERVNLTLK